MMVFIKPPLSVGPPATTSGSMPKLSEPIKLHWASLGPSVQLKPFEVKLRPPKSLQIALVESSELPLNKLPSSSTGELLADRMIPSSQHPPTEVLSTKVLYLSVRLVVA